MTTGLAQATSTTRSCLNLADPCRFHLRSGGRAIVKAVAPGIFGPCASVAAAEGRRADRARLHDEPRLPPQDAQQAHQRFLPRSPGARRGQRCASHRPPQTHRAAPLPARAMPHRSHQPSNHPPRSRPRSPNSQLEKFNSTNRPTHALFEAFAAACAAQGVLVVATANDEGHVEIARAEPGPGAAAAGLPSPQWQGEPQGVRKLGAGGFRRPDVPSGTPEFCYEHTVDNAAAKVTLGAVDTVSEGGLCVALDLAPPYEITSSPPSPVPPTCMRGTTTARFVPILRRGRRPGSTLTATAPCSLKRCSCVALPSGRWRRASCRRCRHA